MRDMPQTETVAMSQTLALSPSAFGRSQPLFHPIRLRRPAFGRRRAMAGLPPIPAAAGWTLTWRDARDFLMAYSASVIAIGLFIA